jgi:hypothetical protein
VNSASTLNLPAQPASRVAVAASRLVTLALHFVERLEHIDAFGHDEIGEQQLVGGGQGGRSPSRQLGRIAGQVPNQNIRVDEPAQRRRPARSARERRRTLSQGVPRDPRPGVPSPVVAPARPTSQQTSACTMF